MQPEARFIFEPDAKLTPIGGKGGDAAESLAQAMGEVGSMG